MDGLASQLGRPVLGHDHVHLVAGVVITAPASNHGTIRDRDAAHLDGRGEAEQRLRLKRQRRPGHEVLVAADPGVLSAVDRVGDHLSLDVDCHRAADRDHLAVARDHVGRVDDLDWEEGDVLVAVEPFIQPLGAGGERRDRDAVELALAVGDLAGLVQRASARS